MEEIIKDRKCIPRTREHNSPHSKKNYMCAHMCTQYKYKIHTDAHFVKSQVKKCKMKIMKF